MSHAGSAEQCRAVLQCHPTSLCNLACIHCYSSSSPKAVRGLAPSLVAGAVEDAAALGVSVLSLSGGEPLLYYGLNEVMQTARRLDVQVNLVSNGILIPSDRFARHADDIGVVALSLDGLRDRHNAIRKSVKQFDQVRRAAEELVARGRAFGIIHTLCSESLEELEDIAALASDWGASLLQLHPFEASGRGLDATGLTPLSAEQRLDAFLIGLLLGEQYPHMRIHVDLVHRDVARHAPSAIHGSPVDEPLMPRELVLQDNGLVVPLTYGLSASYAIANLTCERLGAAWGNFAAVTWPALRRRLRAACLAAARGRHGDVVAWHAVVREYAAQAAYRVGAASGPKLSYEATRLA